MKRKASLLFILLIVCTVTFSFISHASFEDLPLNAPIAKGDYKMKDVSGKETCLNEVKTPKGLLVIFTCNTCPYVKLSESRIKEYSDYCLANGIGCILVNSNEGQRNEDDSFEKNDFLLYFSKFKMCLCS